MAPALSVDLIRSSVLPVVLSLSNDRIPNIRFNVAKALETLSIRLGSPFCNSTISGQGQSGGKELLRTDLLPALDKLVGDKDADVRFFAEKGRNVAEGFLSGEGGQGEVTMSDA